MTVAGTGAGSRSGRAFWVALLATWFGSGRLPLAPGSWGSAAALPFAWGLSAAGGWPLLLAASVVLLGIGIPVAAAHAGRLQRPDPGEVVIDEVVGQWLTLLAMPLTPTAYVLGFLCFRVADILKPWPASWADRRLGGGLGIMVDDVLAALWAWPATWLCHGVVAWLLI